MERKYISSIEFDKPGDMRGHFLKVKLTFKQPVTQEDYESSLDCYQWIFSQKAGRQVPREEISVNPKVGEWREVELNFIARLGSPLYCGLKNVHERAPYVLPRFIEELDNYQKEHQLRHMDLNLLHHLVDGLIDIVEPKDKPKSLGRRLLPFLSRS